LLLLFLPESLQIAQHLLYFLYIVNKYLFQVGGNAPALAFFSQHGWTSGSGDQAQKYNSRAAQMYRERLHAAALKVLKSDGKRLHLDASGSGSADQSSPGVKEVEFFQEENFFGKAANLCESKSDPVLIEKVSKTATDERGTDGEVRTVDDLPLKLTGIQSHAEGHGLHYKACRFSDQACVWQSKDRGLK